MIYLISIGLLVGTFFFMEGVAWFSHKYIMHGFMWRWHQSHHIPHKNTFEKNDLFSVVFSIPAIFTIILGFEIPNLWWLKWIGFGVTAYGIFYLVFHDIIVHRRVKIKHKAKTKYMQRMIRAHKVHHKFLDKEGAEAFGFLYAPSKYKAKSTSIKKRKQSNTKTTT